MTIDKLLGIYQSVREGVSDNNLSYSLGASSLRLVRQEIVDNKIPISAFNIHDIVLYGIVSVLHPNEQPQWKCEETRRVCAFSLDAIKAYVKNHLNTKSSQRKDNEKI